MSATLLLAGALLAQTGAPLMVRGGEADRSDVAYEELMAGRNAAAVELISASRLDDRRDPCALINLGTAHARLGHKETAASLYRAAMSSRERYDLQLSDGSWIDSRLAARKAARLLEQGQALALR